MQRRPMPPRKSPMPRGKGFPPRSSGLSRRGALQRQSERTRDAEKAAAAKSAKTEPKTKPAKPLKRGRMDPDLRASIWERSNGSCDICGRPLSASWWECHHRRLRSQGGQDEPENLLALHDACHQDAHHRRDWARECGYIVHAGDEPASRPVLRHGWCWQIPTIDGWVSCPSPIDPSKENAA